METKGKRATTRLPAWARAALAAILIGGTLLRFAGLSHGLAEGHVYHPDTPKQIRAVEQHLEDLSPADYDGHPCFANRLVAMACRVTYPVLQGCRQVLGFPVLDGWPEPRTLHWIARLLNASLASLLIYLLFTAVRREWGIAAALLSVLLLACSPVDVVACHYESGDTVAGFFAALAVFWSLRVYRTGALSAIAVGMFAAVCSFASAYQGGLSALAVVLAFALRQSSLRVCFERTAWPGWLTMTLVALGSLFLTIPGLLSHPGRFIHVICASLTPAPPQPLSFVLITPLVFAAAAVVLTYPHRVRMRPAIGIAAVTLGLLTAGRLLNLSMGEAFFFVHRDTRCMAQEWTRENVPRSFSLAPEPFTFLLPDHGLATGGVRGSVWARSRLGTGSPPAGSFRLMQFRLEDESLPVFRNPVIDLYLGHSPSIRAGFRQPVFLPIPSQSGDQLVFDSFPGFLRQGKVLDVDPALPMDRTFVCEQPVDEALAVVHGGGAPVLARVSFAGVAQEVSLGPGEVRLLRFPHPVASWPRRQGGTLYRSSIRVGPGRAYVSWAFTDMEKGVALSQAGLLAEAAPYLREASAADPRQPTLAVLARLASASAAPPLPPDEREQLDQRAQHFAEPWTEDRVAAVYGLAPAYLESLPYLNWSTDSIAGAGIDPEPVDEVSDAEGEESAEPASIEPARSWWMRSPHFRLSPGAYWLLLEYASGAASIQTNTLEVTDPSGRAVLFHPIPPAPSRRSLRARLVLPEGLAEGCVMIRGVGPGLRVDRIGIEPDVLGTLNHLGAAWRVVAGKATEEDSGNPFSFAAWLARGRQEAADGHLEAAVEHCARARALQPDRVEPVLEMAALSGRFASRFVTNPPPAVVEALRLWMKTASARELHPVDVDFGHQLALVGFRLRQNEISRGGQLGLNLYWAAGQPGRLGRRCGAWVHLINEAGKKVFQADRDLAGEWANPRGLTELDPAFYLTAVPPDVPPGRYRILVGLYEPDSGRRFKPEATRLPVRSRGVELPVTLTVR